MAIAEELGGAILLDSATHSTRWGGLLFVAVALCTPEGWSDGVPAEPLEKHTKAYMPTGIQPDGDNLLDFFNALWVRARLPMALGFAPPTCRHSIRSRFLDAALLAVSGEGDDPRVTPSSAPTENCGPSCGSGAIVRPIDATRWQGPFGGCSPRTRRIWPTFETDSSSMMGTISVPLWSATGEGCSISAAVADRRQ